MTKKEKRQCMSKLRCSNHSLALKCGDIKTCKLTKDFVQNVMKLKTKFISSQTFSQLDDEELFIKLMTNNCVILGKLLPFIRACFEIRRILGVGL